MKEDLLDVDGYPLESTLAKVREWPWSDPLGLFAFLQDVWYMSDWGWHEKEGRGVGGEAERRFYFSTAGWSGNEDLVGALADNALVWTFYWWQSRRGGHYEFRVPLALAKPAEEEPKA